ncbi:MAG: T9SS type A sorting domain-containing protein [Candidatus Zixiibacteriota bacterium]|nr:MAG: T9SS type A sorting domain-containing protein [candidate division Zixibacteria bacterium]
MHLVWTGSVIDYLPPVKPNYTKSTDAGLTWSDNVELGVCGTGSQYAAISANDKGNVAVLWIGQSHNVNLRVSHDFGDTWEPAVEITSNNTARRTCDIRLTGNSILTCWQDYRYDPDLGAIYFKKSLDGGQSWEDEYYVDRNSDHSWNPSLTGTVDRHYMIWYDGRSVGGPGIYFSRWPDEITSVDNEDRILPEKISLYAYPNPFNSSTTITYNGLAPGYIGIYDIRGRLVKRLQLSDRTKSITWDASSDDGSWITSGVYFIRAIDSEHDYKACIKLLYIK